MNEESAQRTMDVRTSLALSNGAASVVSLAELVSDDGAPFTAGTDPHQVVVVHGPPTCSHDGGRSEPPPSSMKAQFDTNEHMSIVSGLTLQFPDSRLRALDTFLELTPDFKLTYGQVICLGGDFYGDPKRPVCTAGRPNAQIAQFKSNFESLQSSRAEATKLLAIALQYEYEPIQRAIREHRSPSSIYESIPWTTGWTMNDEDQEFDQATGGGGPGSTKFGRYSDLALSNLDHFGVDAVACYTAGHILAQRQAVEARGSADSHGALALAYAINAFADHFLTDLFSAGHMRTPRRKIYEYENYVSGLKESLSGACAKAMHDEDSKFGLWVTNARGDRWVAYGDARYRDWCNAANRVIVKRAVQQSMDDIWDAYKTGTVRGAESQVFQYLPLVITEMPQKGKAQQHRDDRHNWAPLFWWNPDDDYIYVRDDLDDVSVRSYEWKTVQGLGATAGALIARAALKLPHLMPRREYASASYPYPPDEKGASGQIGWPAGPTSPPGVSRVKGATGPDLRGLSPTDWRVDGTTGPAGPGV